LRRFDAFSSVNTQGASNASQFKHTLLIVQALHSISMQTLVMKTRIITFAALETLLLICGLSWQRCVKKLCNPQGWM